VSEKTILKLQLPTDPLWVKNVVESNIEELLTDHVFCEQKAASNAITLIVQNPNLSDLMQYFVPDVVLDFIESKNLYGK
jgi:tRNA-(ms[2]io[6]A)-hydroxylase